MNKLCLGTYLTVLTHCKNNPKTSGQLKILNVLITSIVGEETQISAPEVSKIRKGTKDIESYVADKIRYALDNAKEYSEIKTRFKTKLLPLLHPDKIPEACSAISRIILEDESIEKTYEIDPLNNISKGMLPLATYESSFLLGVFIYAFKHTNNVKCESYVAEITAEFIKESMNYELIEYIASAHFSPSKAFCIKYENDMALLPLCQIANIVNPTHNHVNPMYTEYCQFPEGIQREIMSLNDFPMLQFKVQNLYVLLSKYEDIIKEMGLSSDRYLYAFSQYLPYSLNFEDTIFEAINPPIFPVEPSKYFPNRTTSDLSAFLDEYLFYKDKKENLIKPLDWLWENLNLGSCPEIDFIYWYNLFCLVSCYFIKKNASNKNSPVSTLSIPSISSLQTMEDLHFAMLLNLYQSVLI